MTASGDNPSLDQGQQVAVPTEIFSGVYWGSYGEQTGILRISRVLLRGYRQLGMTDREFLWTLHVLSHQFKAHELPYPSHGQLAALLGFKDRKLSRRVAAGLVTKGLLTTQSRGTFATLAFDFSPLFIRVNELAQAEAMARQAERQGKVGPKAGKDARKTAALWAEKAVRSGVQWDTT